MRQHIPLAEVLRRLQEGGGGIIERYLRCPSHVCRQVYADPESAERALPSIEAAWPEYAELAVLLAHPAYPSARVDEPSSLIAEGQQRLNQCLGVRAQAFQERRHHHAHPATSETGERGRSRADIPKARWAQQAFLG